MGFPFGRTFGSLVSRRATLSPPTITPGRSLKFAPCSGNTLQRGQTSEKDSIFSNVTTVKPFYVGLDKLASNRPRLVGKADDQTKQVLLFP